jgi:hypothetical protein
VRETLSRVAEPGTDPQIAGRKANTVVVQLYRHRVEVRADADLETPARLRRLEAVLQRILDQGL